MLAPLLVYAGALGAAPSLLAACGPSFHVVYEGNARFERCYALEEDPRVGMPDKAACWREWSERYTYGQTRDRVHYATARFVALSRAPAVPTDEALMMAAPGETPRATTISAPAPTSAFAPPPKVLDPAEGAPPAPAPAVSAASPPGAPPEPAGPPALVVSAANPPAAPPARALPASTCADGCAETYRACSARCEPDAATKACRACALGYRACMRGCFK